MTFLYNLDLKRPLSRKITQNFSKNEHSPYLNFSSSKIHVNVDRLWRPLLSQALTCSTSLVATTLARAIQKCQLCSLKVLSASPPSALCVCKHFNPNGRFKCVAFRLARVRRWVARFGLSIIRVSFRGLLRGKCRGGCATRGFAQRPSRRSPTGSRSPKKKTNSVVSQWRNSLPAAAVVVPEDSFRRGGFGKDKKKRVLTSIPPCCLFGGEGSFFAGLCVCECGLFVLVLQSPVASSSSPPAGVGDSKKANGSMSSVGMLKYSQ